MGAQVRTRFKVSHNLGRAAATIAIKAGWAALGRAWHENILPKHFKEGAKREYNYKRRNRRYVARKHRQFGHTRPLERTGKLKRMVLRQRRVSAQRGRSVGGAKGGVKINVFGPRYLYQFRKNLRQPDKAKELGASSKRDTLWLEKAIDRFLAAEFNKPAPTVEIR